MKISKLLVAVGIVLMGVSVWFLVNRSNSVKIDETEKIDQNPKSEQTPLSIGKVTILVEVRRSEAEQALGLSWRPSMGETEGMAFTYPKPVRVSYWMKGMQFPLDFIWVRQGKVVEMTKRVEAPTDNNPKIRTISPLNEVDMVIEVNAGFVEKYGIKIGDEVVY